MKAVVLAVTVAALPPFALGEVGAAPLGGKPHVTLQQARATALKLRPGTVRKSELERERGGSGLRYSFDIDVKNTLFEVGVDANSGRVLENAKA